ncbi:MAG: methylated-DNA--[protein]-cysteine S-methyltransferase [Proteobacteria bacterium]|nr:methylated-DNA--[protein]-cysteine S-methyltransferase [Pseudomonadota bacterium]MBU1612751.1 methylated-DNA--[protein]-cysteine S-methyltransferase [Pseudomonadota bacterium]
MTSTTRQRVERVEMPPLAVTITWEGDVVRKLNVGRSGTGTTASPSALAMAYKTALGRYVAGEPVDWPEAPIDMDSLTPFSKQVLVALRRHAPHGTRLTYGQLATLAGAPGSARAVGRVMANNPWPLLYPCHRVVGSTGALTGFSAEGGIETKELMLGIETRGMEQA